MLDTGYGSLVAGDWLPMVDGWQAHMNFNSLEA